MDVIGDLIRLEPDRKLPIPWQCRAHLGIQSGTRVSVGIIASGAKDVPSIIVTPIKNPSSGNYKYIRCQVKEAVGSINEALGYLKPFNIGMSDSVTIEGRGDHILNLVLEDPHPHSTGEDSPEFTKKVNEVISQLNKRYVVEEISQEPYLYEVDWLNMATETVLNGFIDDGGAWLKVLERKAKNQNVELSEYDFSRIVCSSSTEARLVRYVVPKKGAKEIFVPHNDRPGSLENITKILANAGVNVLSHRVSREKDNVFCGVCEPSVSGQEIDIGKLLPAFDEPSVQVLYGYKNITVSSGVPAAKTIFLRASAHSGGNRQDRVRHCPCEETA